MSNNNYLENLPNYQEKEGESYMNPDQLEHFKNKLLAWKRMIMKEVDETIHNMRENSQQATDSLDRASLEESLTIELRTRNREYKLIQKIDDALYRIETKEYGYCKISGEQIGINRLDARPTSDLSIEAKQQLELEEKNRHLKLSNQ